MGGQIPYKPQDFSLVIPTYNHGNQISKVIDRAKPLGFSVIVVDDGSTDSTWERIRHIPDIKVIRHQRNLGKGEALLTGMAEAAKTAKWAVTLDADNQHDPPDARCLIRAIPEGTRPIVVGQRTTMENRDVPWTSRYGRRFSNFWVLISGGPDLWDSQCGFRIYPLPETLDLDVVSRRFQFEVEVLVKAKWKGIPIIETPVGVTYQSREERISHFRPLVDFLMNARTFSRLILQRLINSLRSAEYR